jgi:hypothetical protein
MAGVDRDGDSSEEKKSNKSNPSKRPASRPKAYLSGSDKEPQAQESSKKYLISRLFSTYQSIKNENDTKSNSHSSRKEIRFNIDEYIIRNTALPNYFNMSADEIGNSVNDFYVKTKCFYLANSEIEGMLILQKDKMVFRSSTAYDYSNIEKLK